MDASLIFPNNLFPNNPVLRKSKKVFLIQDPLFFLDEKFPISFHKKKILLHLSSLTFLQLAELKNEYENLGYSTLELKLHNQKIISYPFFITIMTLFSGIIMLNIKFNRSKIFYLMIGILTSVSIYYVNYFSGILGENEKIPVSLSIWMPIFIFGLFSSIGMVKINEK